MSIPGQASMAPRFASVVPVQFAQNLMGVLQSTRLIGDVPRQDVLSVLENPRSFARQLRTSGESQLVALERLDGRVIEGLPENEIPGARRTLVGPDFFKRGETSEKVGRYVEMLRQYVHALPMLVEADSVFRPPHKDRRVPIATSVELAKRLLADDLQYPATDLLAVGIREAFLFMMEDPEGRYRVTSNTVRQIQSVLYMTQAISEMNLDFQYAAALYLSLFAVATHVPSIGQGFVFAGVLTALSRRGMLDANLVTPDQLDAAGFIKRLVLTEPPFLAPKDLEEYGQLAAEAIDALKI